MSDKSTPPVPQALIDQTLDHARVAIHQQPTEAEALLKQFLRCCPEHPEGLHLLGIALNANGKAHEACELLQLATELEPTRADNFHNLGLAYASAGNLHQALVVINQAIELDPEAPPERMAVYFNSLGDVQRKLGNFDEAFRQIRQAIERDPDARYMNNLGGVYLETQDLDRAEVCFDAVLRELPHYPPAHVDKAYVHFYRQEWELGFAEYRWRYDRFAQLKEYTSKVDPKTRWDGSPLNGRTLFLYGEQGFGDMIMMARYIGNLHGRVILRCPQALHRLFGQFSRVECTEVFPEATEYDVHTGTFDLPNLKVRSLEQPYLQSQALPMMGTNVGVCWSGSRHHPNDAKRSLKVEDFTPLSTLSGVRLINLNHEEPRHRPFEMIDLPYADFQDLAKIVRGLDLVISCDTAVVHVAGALGVKCWALLPFHPDWRWGLTDRSTRWYDSVVLFRQPRPGDWASVMEAVRMSLQEFVAIAGE